MVNIIFRVIDQKKLRCSYPRSHNKTFGPLWKKKRFVEEELKGLFVRMVPKVFDSGLICTNNSVIVLLMHPQ